FKMWELSGTEITASGEDKPFVAYCSTFDNKKIAEGRESFDVPVTHFNLNAAAEVKKEKVVLHSENQGKDDGGGTSLSGAWKAKRVQVWGCSDDGIHWKNEQLVV